MLRSWESPFANAWGRSRWRLPQSRDRGLQGSTHCGNCVHGSHLLSTDHDRRDASTPAARHVACTHDVGTPWRPRSIQDWIRTAEQPADQRQARRSLGGLFRAQEVEATSGFEPLNRGFADLPLRPLGYVASDVADGDRRSRNRSAVWLPLEDSNLGSRIQSPLSYH